MINLQLSQDTALNLFTRIQDKIQLWNSYEFLEKDIEELCECSVKLSRKLELFTDLEIAEIPFVNFSFSECLLLTTLVNRCDRKLEKAIFQPINQQFIALGEPPVIIEGYSEWEYMWEEFDKSFETETREPDWTLSYIESDLERGHIFECTHEEIDKELSLVIPFSKNFKRAMGMPL